MASQAKLVYLLEAWLWASKAKKGLGELVGEALAAPEKWQRSRQHDGDEVK